MIIYPSKKYSTAVEDVEMSAIAVVLAIIACEISELDEADAMLFNLSQWKVVLKMRGESQTGKKQQLLDLLECIQNSFSLP